MPPGRKEFEGFLEDIQRNMDNTYPLRGREKPKIKDPEELPDDYPKPKGEVIGCDPEDIAGQA